MDRTSKIIYISISVVMIGLILFKVLSFMVGTQKAVTDFTTGLARKDITKAIKILNGDFDYINCEFSIDELRLLQGALKLCEDKQNFNLDETYLRSIDLRNKISRILKTNDTSQQHFGRPLEGA